jgi:N-glycosidase YbiA
MPIYFYSNIDEYGCFSNFSPHGFEVDGVYWPTVEHYFQAQKFAGTEYEILIRQAKSPKQAKSQGRRRDWPLREDWEAVKVDLMRRAVRRKFETHEDIRVLLIGTGDEELIENAPNDYFWGCGRFGSGQNMLGKILMEARESFHEPDGG